MVLPKNAAGAIIRRHPSTIYEMLLEGVVMFFILQVFIGKPRPRMAASGLLVLGYGFFRTFVEFFRQPDAQLGVNGFLYDTDWITLGITLSVPQCQ
ncbi:MAG: prolipoprotein diacylglyceryl transferase [Agarilytica sp.]